MKIKAVVLMGKCPKSNGKAYGMRTELIHKADSTYVNDVWARTWSFPMDLSKAKKEGYDNTSINGDLVTLKTYPGCPYCGSIGFVLCNCGKLNCYNGETSLKCQWCGELMDNISSFDGPQDYSVGGDY